MFKNIKKGIKRAIIFILILGAIAVIVITFTNLFGDRIFSHRLEEVWIDTDAGKDIDDLFAISRLLIDKNFEISGISTVHYELLPGAPGKSAQISYDYIEKLLALHEKDSIPHYSGANKMLWFEETPVPVESLAVNKIIECVKNLRRKEKLNFVAFGSLTNLASAIIKDPEIAEKISVYLLVMKFNSKTNVWDKNEFNARNDLDALDIILNNNSLDLNIMPLSTSRDLIFDYTEAEDKIGKDTCWNYLLSAWKEISPDQMSKSMNAVALVEAIINEDHSKIQKVVSPPENNQRAITVYTGINKEMMYADYWSEISSYRMKKKIKSVIKK